jgi:hypothetical protein
MAIEINHTPTFTVKYVEGGIQKFMDLQATGITDAKDQFSKSNPDAEVINIWRKS